MTEFRIIPLWPPNKKVWQISSCIRSYALH